MRGRSIGSVRGRAYDSRGHAVPTAARSPAFPRLLPARPDPPWARRPGRPGPRVDRGGEPPSIPGRGAADQLTPEDLRAAWFAGAAGLHLPAYSLLNEPLGAAAPRAAHPARAAGAT